MYPKFTRGDSQAGWMIIKERTKQLHAIKINGGEINAIPPLFFPQTVFIFVFWHSVPPASC